MDAGDEGGKEASRAGHLRAYAVKKGKRGARVGLSYNIGVLLAAGRAVFFIGDLLDGFGGDLGFVFEERLISMVQ